MDTKVQDVLGGFEVGSANVKSLEEKVAAMESEVRSTEQQVKNMNSKIYTEQYTIEDLKSETLKIVEQIKNLEFELQTQSDLKESLLLDLRNVENQLIAIKEQTFQRKNEYIRDMVEIEVEYMKSRESTIKDLESARL